MKVTRTIKIERALTQKDIKSIFKALKIPKNATNVVLKDYSIGESPLYLNIFESPHQRYDLSYIESETTEIP